MNSSPAELLRSHGLQITAQRLAILRSVAAKPHSTADAVADQVRRELGTISRQAVYDALNLLVEQGILRRIQPAGSAALYEDRVGDNHHHVICLGCGQTADVDCALGSAPCLSAATTAGYQIVEAEVIYWGTCPVCQSKQSQRAKARSARKAKPSQLSGDSIKRSRQVRSRTTDNVRNSKRKPDLTAAQALRPASRTGSKSTARKGR